jgi:hypothetical protein
LRGADSVAPEMLQRDRKRPSAPFCSIRIADVIFPFCPSR